MINREQFHLKMITRDKRVKMDRSIFNVGDLNSEILEYVSPGTYLFYAPVCRDWCRSWEKSRRDAVTDVETVDSSFSQIKECVDLGIEAITPSMLKTVAMTGDIDLVKIMCMRLDSLVNDGNVLTSAVYSGNLDLVMWLYHEQNCSVHWSPLDVAAEIGDTVMYSWLYEKGASRTWLTASKAASMGYLDILKIMRSHECADNLGPGFCQTEYDEAVSAATTNKKVHVLDWLVQVGVGN